MKKVENSKKICMLLAIVLLFSTVLPVSASAEDSSFIMNVVTSSHSTGGKTSAGSNGSDGIPGADGQPGSSGASVINIDDNSTVSIQSSTNNAQTLDIQESEDSTKDVYQASGSEVAVLKDEEINKTSGSSEGILSALRQTLLSLQLILANYVSVLL